MANLLSITLLMALLAAPGAAQKPHWAFQQVVRPPVPVATTSEDRRWIRTPMDAFVLAGLKKRGLTPSPEADRRTLLRRLSYDLTGLPPTPDEIRQFLADRSPSAYDRQVKRLLASPAFGERWAQHWLDVVRFGETNGYELDAERPQAWRYRDWVIGALNADMPYDRFLRAQVAGDEIAPNDFDMRVATGFLRAGPQHVVGGNQDEAVNRQEWLTEATTGIGSAVLGLTIQCARCHDHKYDPIPQADYYRLQAFFAGSDNHRFENDSPAIKRSAEEAHAAFAARLKPLETKIAEIEKPYRERLRQEKESRITAEQRAALDTPRAKQTPRQRQLLEEVGILRQISWDELVAALTPVDRAHRADLRARLHRLEQDAPDPFPAAPGVAETRSPVPATFVMRRGDPHTPGDEVQPGFPTVLLRSESQSVSAAETKPRRLGLAEWLTRPDNPLTARVFVNRVWQRLFGEGIVGTPNDFGRNGRQPTNPALLDWLASAFVTGDAGGTVITSDRSRGAWSLKRLITLVVISSAYRQSSAYDPARARIDPLNQSVWRMNRRRLDAEAIRDSILLSAGVLNRQSGGPSVLAPLEPEVVATIFTEGEPDDLWPVTPDPKQHARRSIYLFRKRNVKVPLLELFDQPDTMSSCAARLQSVHALQALNLLNSPFMVEQSRNLAVRIWREAPASDDGRIQRLALLCLGRPPSDRETRATRRFLADAKALAGARLRRGERVDRPGGVPASVSTAEAVAWTDLCLATLNLNDFVTER